MLHQPLTPGNRKIRSSVRRAGSYIPSQNSVQDNRHKRESGIMIRNYTQDGSYDRSQGSQIILRIIPRMRTMINEIYAGLFSGPNYDQNQGYIPEITSVDIREILGVYEANMTTGSGDLRTASTG